MCISNDLNLKIIADTLIKSQHVKYKSVAINRYKSVENMYEKYFSLLKFYELSTSDTISIIRNKIEYGRINKNAITLDFFKIIFLDEIVATNAYMLYCDSKTKKMREVISSDIRLYSMNLESFIFREGKESGTISYRNFCNRQKLTSKRSIEYWKLNSNTQEEAIAGHKNYQTMFSLEKCIQKYGHDRGAEIWNDRQVRWQQSIKQKDNYGDICKRRSLLRKDYLISKYGNSWKLKTLEGFNKPSYFLDSNKALYELLSPNERTHWKLGTFINRVPKYIWVINEVESIDEKTILIKNMLDHYGIILIDTIQSKSRFKSYMKYVDEGVLLSSNEIYFYSLLKEYNVQFTLNRRYPNSKLRYDFYLTDYDIYVELTTNLSTKNIEKLRRKALVHDFVLLTKKVDYSPFLNLVIANKASSSNTTCISVDG